METTHNFYTEDSRKLDVIEDDSVDLVVTSPPYPMIKLWDDAFGRMNNSITEAIENENDVKAYELMNQELDKVWDEVNRVTKEDSIVCINIGDASRKLSEYQHHPNHSWIIQKFINMGWQIQSKIIWRKPSTKSNKFFGSVNLPPNSYVTFEHEYILIFRKNGCLSYDDTDLRYKSSYFYNERNKWFSSPWSITGARQDIDKEVRDKSAAYPLEVPYRLINMFSTQNDTVLDPFTGSGTTNLASAMSGRNSIGVDISEDMIQVAKQSMKTVKQSTYDKNEQRIENHLQYVKESDKTMNYDTRYDFGSITKQAKRIRIPYVESVKYQDPIRIKHKFVRD